MSFQDLIRSGNEQGLLLGDWPTWRRYREMRSKPVIPMTKVLRSKSWPGFLLFWKKPAICATH
jgi:hypothetical protein